MDMSVNGMVNASMALQQHQLTSDVQTSVLKKSLDGQAEQMSQLMSSVDSMPKLATEGMVGTRINTTA
ncbi:Putative motility protein [Kushneria avicenniae]|uniref:Putative motility protein n=1 Tax=Kushneria avicenniae TaxID=402385 RepID=A0A1I1L5V0_9GAMM|nr:putative motility protein [Kushneria avicenniae]SFC64960.1 Putative motility protein [Kushneria avicenniae]